MKCPHCHFEFTPKPTVKLPRSWVGLGAVLFALFLCAVWMTLGALFFYIVWPVR